MTDPVRSSMATPRGARLLLGSNLFLLPAVGSYDTGLIQTFKRVSSHTLAEYRILQHFASGFPDIVVTPHILTEVSNLANSLPQHVKARWVDLQRRGLQAVGFNEIRAHYRQPAE